MIKSDCIFVFIYRARWHTKMLFVDKLHLLMVVLWSYDLLMMIWVVVVVFMLEIRVANRDVLRQKV